MSKCSSLPAQNTSHIWQIARDELAAGRKVAVATVIDCWGSSPVPVGGQMVVLENGTFQGSVSGGCVETDVIVAADDAMKSGRSERLRFGVTDETAWKSGLPCGGDIQILVQPFAGQADLKFAQRMAEARATRRIVQIAYNLTSGERTIYDHPGAMSETLQHKFKSGDSGLANTGEHEVFIHSVVPQPRILIVGATHIAQALVAISKTIELTPAVIDPRESFASQDRFGDTRILLGWPKDVLPTFELDTHTALVALAHVDHIDDEALTCALESPACYIGALGSTRNHARRKARLAEAGFSQSAIDRIHCPIGLDIGAITPEEIALAVAAEVVLALRGPKRKRSE